MAEQIDQVDDVLIEDAQDQQTEEQIDERELKKRQKEEVSRPQKLYRALKKQHPEFVEGVEEDEFSKHMSNPDVAGRTYDVLEKRYPDFVKGVDREKFVSFTTDQDQKEKKEPEVDEWPLDDLSAQEDRQVKEQGLNDNRPSLPIQLPNGSIVMTKSRFLQSLEASKAILAKGLVSIPEMVETLVGYVNPHDPFSRSKMILGQNFHVRNMVRSGEITEEQGEEMKAQFREALPPGYFASLNDEYGFIEDASGLVEDYVHGAKEGFEESIWLTAKHHGFGAAAQHLGVALTESSIPLIAGLALGGAPGLTLLGGTTGAAKFTDKGGENASPEDVLNSLITGISEGLTEKITFGLAGKAAKQVAGEIGQEALKDGIVRTWKESIGNFIGTVLKGATMEGGSETINAIVEASADIILSGENLSKMDIINRLSDAALVGATMGGGISTVGATGTAIRDAVARANPPETTIGEVDNAPDSKILNDRGYVLEVDGATDAAGTVAETNKLRDIGKKVDDNDATWEVTPLRGTVSGRKVVEVEFSTGDRVLFYESSGKGSDPATQGEWVPIPGFAKDGWFVKTSTKEAKMGKYGSTKFQEIAAKLKAPPPAGTTTAPQAPQRPDRSPDKGYTTTYRGIDYTFDGEKWTTPSGRTTTQNRQTALTEQFRQENPAIEPEVIAPPPQQDDTLSFRGREYKYDGEKWVTPKGRPATESRQKSLNQEFLEQGTPKVNLTTVGTEITATEAARFQTQNAVTPTVIQKVANQIELGTPSITALKIYTNFQKEVDAARKKSKPPTGPQFTQGVTQLPENQAALKQKIESDFKRSKKMLSKVAPGAKLVIHDTQGSYDAQLAAMNQRGQSDTGGFYDPKTNTVHVNLQRAPENVIAHESGHPLLNLVFAARPEVVERMYDDLVALSERFPDVKMYLEFSKKYNTSDTLSKQEALIEFIADVVEGKVDINQIKGGNRFINQVKDWFKSLISRFFGRTNIELTDLTAFAETIRRANRTRTAAVFVEQLMMRNVVHNADVLAEAFGPQFTKNKGVKARKNNYLSKNLKIPFFEDPQTPEETRMTFLHDFMNRRGKEFGQPKTLEELESAVFKALTNLKNDILDSKIGTIEDLSDKHLDFLKQQAIDDLQDPSYIKMFDEAKTNSAKKRSVLEVFHEAHKKQYQDWLRYMARESMRFDSLKQYDVLSDVVKFTHINGKMVKRSKNTSAGPMGFSPAALDLAVNQMTPDGQTFMNRYVDALEEMDRRKEAAMARLSEGGMANQTGWIKIPGRQEDPQNFESNVDLLVGLAMQTEWCTATMGREHLEKGDYHLYLKEGKVGLGIRTEGGDIAEPIRGIGKGQSVTPEFAGVGEGYIRNTFPPDQAAESLQELENKKVAARLVRDGVQTMDDLKALEKLFNEYSVDYSEFNFGQRVMALRPSALEEAKQVASENDTIIVDHETDQGLLDTFLEKWVIDGREISSVIPSNAIRLGVIPESDLYIDLTGLSKPENFTIVGFVEHVNRVFNLKSISITDRNENVNFTWDKQSSHVDIEGVFINEDGESYSRADVRKTLDVVSQIKAITNNTNTLIFGSANTEYVDGFVVVGEAQGEIELDISPFNALRKLKVYDSRNVKFVNAKGARPRPVAVTLHESEGLRFGASFSGSNSHQVIDSKDIVFENLSDKTNLIIEWGGVRYKGRMVEVLKGAPSVKFDDGVTFGESGNVHIVDWAKGAPIKINIGHGSIDKVSLILDYDLTDTKTIEVTGRGQIRFNHKPEFKGTYQVGAPDLYLFIGENINPEFSVEKFDYRLNPVRYTIDAKVFLDSGTRGDRINIKKLVIGPGVSLDAENYYGSIENLDARYPLASVVTVPKLPFVRLTKIPIIVFSSFYNTKLRLAQGFSYPSAQEISEMSTNPDLKEGATERGLVKYEKNVNEFLRQLYSFEISGVTNVGILEVEDAEGNVREFMVADYPSAVEFIEAVITFDQTGSTGFEEDVVAKIEETETTPTGKASISDTISQTRYIVESEFTPEETKMDQLEELGFTLEQARKILDGEGYDTRVLAEMIIENGKQNLKEALRNLAKATRRQLGSGLQLSREQVVELGNIARALSQIFRGNIIKVKQGFINAFKDYQADFPSNNPIQKLDPERVWNRLIKRNKKFKAAVESGLAPKEGDTVEWKGQTMEFYDGQWHGVNSTPSSGGKVLLVKNPNYVNYNKGTWRKDSEGNWVEEDTKEVIRAGTIRAKGIEENGKPIKEDTLFKKSSKGNWVNTVTGEVHRPSESRVSTYFQVENNGRTVPDYQSSITQKFRDERIKQFELERRQELGLAPKEGDTIASSRGDYTFRNGQWETPAGRVAKNQDKLNDTFAQQGQEAITEAEAAEKARRRTTAKRKADKARRRKRGGNTGLEPSLDWYKLDTLNAWREALGLDELPPSEAKAREDMMREVVESGLLTEAVAIAQSIIVADNMGAVSLSTQERDAITLRLVEYRTEYEEVLLEIEDAQANKENVDILLDQATRILSNIDILSWANAKIRSEDGRQLQSHRKINWPIHETFEGYLRMARQQNGGRPLDDNQIDDLKEAHKAITEAKKKVDELDKKYQDKRASELEKQAYKATADALKSKIETDMKIKDLLEKRKKLWQEFKNLFKPGQFNDITRFTLEPIAKLAEIFYNYVQVEVLKVQRKITGARINVGSATWEKATFDKIVKAIQKEWPELTEADIYTAAHLYSTRSLSDKLNLAQRVQRELQVMAIQEYDLRALAEELADFIKKGGAARPGERTLGDYGADLTATLHEIRRDIYRSDLAVQTNIFTELVDDLADIEDTVTRMVNATNNDVRKLEGKRLLKAVSKYLKAAQAREKAADINQVIKELKEARAINAKTQVQKDRKEALINRALSELERLVGRAIRPPQPPDLTRARAQLARARNHGRAILEQIRDGQRSSALAKLGTKMMDTWRTVKVTADFSAALLQSLLMSMAISRYKGRRTWKIAGKGIKPNAAVDAYFAAMDAALSGDGKAWEYYDQLASDPMHRLRERAGLEITVPDGLSESEEFFREGFAKNIPGFNRLVDMSENHMVTLLNYTRAMMFDTWLNANPDSTLAEQQAYASFINNLSGRGTGEWLKGTADAVLRFIFLAPRLKVSRFNVLATVPQYALALTQVSVEKVTGKKLKGKYVGWSRLATPKLVRVIGKDLVMMGIWFGAIHAFMTLILGADFERDPRNSDFGKYQFRGTRIEISAGLGSMIKTLMRIPMVFLQNAGLIEESDRVTQQYFNTRTARDIVNDFGNYSLHPFWQIGFNLTNFSNTIGQYRTPHEVFMEGLAPIVVWETMEYMDMGTMGLNGDAPSQIRARTKPEIAMYALLAFHGANVSAYNQLFKEEAMETFADRADYIPNPTSGLPEWFRENTPAMNKLKQDYVDDFEAAYTLWLYQEGFLEEDAEVPPKDLLKEISGTIKEILVWRYAEAYASDAMLLPINRELKGEDIKSTSKGKARYDNLSIPAKRFMDPTDIEELAETTVDGKPMHFARYIQLNFERAMERAKMRYKDDPEMLKSIRKHRMDVIFDLMEGEEAILEEIGGPIWEEYRRRKKDGEID